MRYKDWRQAEIEDKRPLAQRFQVLPMDGYLGAVGAGPLQQAWNTTAAGSGADLPPPGYVDPQVLAGYRPRRSTGPDNPAIPPMNPDPDYVPGGPERQQQIEYLRSLYAR
jgi:hypothetical protein